MKDPLHFAKSFTGHQSSKTLPQAGEVQQPSTWTLTSRDHGEKRLEKCRIKTVRKAASCPLEIGTLENTPGYRFQLTQC